MHLDSARFDVLGVRLAEHDGTGGEGGGVLPLEQSWEIGKEGRHGRTKGTTCVGLLMRTSCNKTGPSLYDHTFETMNRFSVRLQPNSLLPTF